MLGFDALGRLALGQVSGSVNTTLIAATGSYAISGVAATFKITETANAGSYTLSGSAASFKDFRISATGGYIVTGIPPQLVRTGGDYDQVYGGIGHYLEELEKRRQLEKVTRKTPAPIVQQSIPFPRPLAAPPIAPQAPAIDLQAVAAQRMAEAHAQAEQAKILKRRRQAVEILLLAS